MLRCNGHRRERDRGIFTGVITRASAREEEDRPSILRLWLEERRRALRAAGAREAEIILPGEAFAQTSAFLRAGIAVAGGLFGAGAAWAALTYQRGGEPINALAFFCEFALLQVFILTLALLAFVVALDSRSTWAIALWTIFSGLLLTTQYFSLFQLVPEGAWMFVSLRGRRREVLLALAGLAVIAVSLSVTFALELRLPGFNTLPLRPRLQVIVPQLLASPSPPATALWISALVLVGPLGVNRPGDTLQAFQ